MKLSNLFTFQQCNCFYTVDLTINLEIFWIDLVSVAIKTKDEFSRKKPREWRSVTHHHNFDSR